MSLLATAVTMLGMAVVTTVASAPANADPTDGMLAVQVYRDFPGTGVYDAALDVPQAGIDITVTDAAGNTVTGTSDAAGTYVVSASATLSGGTYRVSASIPSSLNYLEPAPASTAANHFSSFTSFVDVAGGTDQTLTLGVWNPADYTQPNVPVAVPVQSAYAGLGTVPQAMVSTTYDKRGDITNDSSAFIATQDQIGTTMGVAYQKSSSRLFAAAFAKRHTAYGPDGSGAIYVMSADGSGAPSLFTTVPDAGTTAHTDPLRQDANFFDVPGKQSLGGIALSEGGDTLYVVNLNNKTLYSYDAVGATAANPQSSVTIPDPGCAAASDWRPGAVAVHDGVVYVGGVCSAQSTQDRADLKAVVYTYDGSTFTPIVSHPLDFQRGQTYTNLFNPAINSHWNPWVSTWDTSQMTGPSFAGYTRAMPFMASIALDRDGSLILGFRDRLGDQAGSSATTPQGALLAESVATGGDINRVCYDGGAYDWEGSGACPNNNTGGAGGGASDNNAVEYYPGDYNSFVGHYEAAQGGVAYAMREGNVVSTELDPAHAYAPWTGGLGWYDRDTGAGPGTANGNSLQIINTTAGFGKANGLGDIALLADNAPVQIGNRVWFDANNNGLQDPGEAPIPGVTVTLYDSSSTQVAQTTTSTDGEYYFGGAGAAYQLAPGADYTVTFDASTADTSGLPGAPAAADLRFTQQGAGADTAIDSNVTPPTTGTLTTGSATVAAPTDPGEVDHTIDAGLSTPPPAVCAVGDYVWLDANGNGIQDTGEPGVQGVTVTLLDANGDPVNDADGNPVASATTNADGHYVFDNLTCGDYTVTFTDLPPGDTFTQPAQGSDTSVDSNPDATSGATPVFTVTPNGTNTRPTQPGDDAPKADYINPSIDAGLLPPPVCAVGDYAWADANGNGVQDTGEPGIANVTVTLLDANGNPATDADGNPVAATTTDADGHYVFDNLTCGTYTIKFSDLPANYTFTDQDQGSDTSVDSNPDTTSGVTPVFTVDATDANTRPVQAGDGTTNAGLINPTIDAGLIAPTCTIGDYVWVDANGNGVQDTGESGIGGVTVTLLDGNGDPAPGVPPVTTTSDGAYAFTGLACGVTYRVQFTPPAGYTVTQPTQGNDDTKDSNPNPNTGITPTVTPTTTNPVDNTVDAGLIAPVCAVGDYVWIDSNGNGVQDQSESGIAGVTVTLLDGNGNPATDADGNPVAPTTTNGDGHYVFDNLACGKYKVKFTDLPAGYTITRPTQGNDTTADSNPDVTSGTTPVFTVTPGGTDTRPTQQGDDAPEAGYINPSIDAGIVAPVCAVGDYVWVDSDANGVQDTNEPGVQDVTVTLLDANGNPATDADGNPVAAVTTDADGHYVFDNLACGSYAVTFSDLPANYTFTQRNQGNNTTEDSNPVPSTGTTPVFTVSPSQANTRPVQPGDGTTAAGYIDPTIDAGLIAPTCTIGDYVWVDSNGNGVQDSGEPGLGGVTVTLLDANGNPVPGVPPVTTAPDGAYSFMGLDCGATYEVQFTPPAGYTVTQPTQGNDDTKDSNPNPDTGITPAVTPTTGTPTDNTVDAGLIPPVCAVGDYVWTDANGNGIQDAGEPGVQDVTVTLLNPDGSAATDANGDPVAPTTTNGDGHYVFDNLACGKYKVKFTDLPAGYTITQPGQGDDTAEDSNPDVASATTPTFTVSPGGAATRPTQPGDNAPSAGYINPSIDAGIVAPVCAVGDYVWVDSNGDGIQDQNESGIEGVTVTLLDDNGQPAVDADGNPVTPTTTNGDGHYVFDNLACGSYAVKFTDLPAGYTFTRPTQGNDETADSDPDATSGTTPAFTVNPGESATRPTDTGDGTTKASYINPSIDAGIVPPVCAVGDYVWTDANGNGTQDNSESGVAGVTVFLLNPDGSQAVDADGNPVASTTTDSTGHYVFDNIACGKYTVKFTDLPAGYSFTQPTQGGDTSTDSDAAPTSGATPVFTVTPGDTNTRTTEQSDGTTEADYINPTIDAGIVKTPTCTIGDLVWLDTNGNGVQDSGEPGVAGVSVTLLDANGNPVKNVPAQQTGPDGGYEFVGIPCGTYKVKFSDLPDGDGFTQPGQGTDEDKDSNPNPDTGVTPPMTATPNTPVEDTIDAGLVPAPVCAVGQLTFVDSNGNGTMDDGEAPLAGVTVRLFNADGSPAHDASGNPIAPVTTSADGRYVFDNLPCGNYYATFTPPVGYAPTDQKPASDSHVNSTPNASGKTPVFTLAPKADNNRPTKPGDGVSDAASINPTIDAGFTPVCTLSGVVWVDSNDNGLRDSDEDLVSGVTVTLVDRDSHRVKGVAPVTTDNNGAYEFTGLVCGTYRAKFTDVPQGYTFTTQNVDHGKHPATASQADPSSGISALVVLKPGQSAQPVVNAGLVAEVATASGSDLASTGANSRRGLLTGGLLVILGGLMLAAAAAIRRRRHT